MNVEGRRLGAGRAFLDTFTFQAAPFYAKRGYVEEAPSPRGSAVETASR